MEDSNHIHRGLFWLEFPFVEAQRNLNRLPLPPGSPSAPSAVSGIGDVLFRVFAVPWYNEKKTFKALLGVDFYVPSGEGELFFSPATNAFAEESLGSGKYRIAPAVGFVWTPRPNIPIVTVYWYDASFAGDPERSNVRLGKFRIFPRYNFPSGLYVLPQLQVYTNYAHFPAAVDSLFRNTEVFFRPEVGQALGKDATTVYIKWGIGLNDPGQINRKWGLESGFRWRF
jgi:Putative MetA-pathway of phenol degradation